MQKVKYLKTMSNFFKRMNKYTRTFYWYLVFLVTSGLLFLVLPGEPRFRYEYQKGTPWNHENLVAPFDFAILKTQEDLEKDRQEQLKAIIPYFTYDTLMAEQRIQLLETDWLAYNEPGDKTSIDALNALKVTLTGIYQFGILPRSTETYEELTDKGELRKRTGNRVTRVPKESINSEKSAYNLLNNTINTLVTKYPDLEESLLKLQPERYISSNLTYDNNTTQKEREEVIKNISTTRGLVQAGERIILEGEIVNDERHQILESDRKSVV